MDKFDFINLFDDYSKYEDNNFLLNLTFFLIQRLK